MTSSLIAFIGGGNMARAIIAGLIRGGHDARNIRVVEPLAEQRDSLTTTWGVACAAQATEDLLHAQTVFWTIKPQSFMAAASTTQPFVQHALQVSVMAGIRTGTLAEKLQTERIVRAMPNTPALIGQGISGLFARGAVSADEKSLVNALLASTGDTLWLEQEDDLDALTALSGSGPAYVFFVIEALVEAAKAMGLSSQQGLQLALATFKGSTALAISSPDSPTELRQRVTSKGGTTHAAISHLEKSLVKESFIAAVLAARDRAHQMAEEFGA